MERITDEILNKYIDGELTSTDLTKFNSLIKEDSISLDKLSALKSVDQALQKLEPEIAPSGVTQKIMKQINSAKSYIKYEADKKFVFAIMSFLLFAVLFALVLIAIMSPEISEVSNSMSMVSNYFKNLTFSLDFLKDSTFLILTGSISMILLIVAYFIFESHKSFKQNIESLSH